MRNGFVGLYTVGTLLALPVILWRAPELLLGWLAFAAFLSYWTWQVRRVDIEPYVVEVDAERFARTWTGGVDSVDRAAVAAVRSEMLLGARTGPVPSVRLIGHDGATLLHVSLPRDARDETAAAMASLGWPTERPGRATRP